MITYQELMDHVTQRGGVSDNHEARLALEAVTGELARHADPGTRERFLEQLPTALSGHIPAPRGDVEEREEVTSGQLAREVAEQVGCPPEQGARLTRVVLSSIHLSEPEIADALASRLPGEFAQWAAEPDSARARADTGESGAPSRLDQATLDRALERLSYWQGDTRGLTRSVELPDDRVAPLLNQVDRVARVLDHPYDHELTDSGVAFTVRTSSVGAVTTRDIEMAERIDAAIAQVGSGG